MSNNNRGGYWHCQWQELTISIDILYSIEPPPRSLWNMVSDWMNALATSHVESRWIKMSDKTVVGARLSIVQKRSFFSVASGDVIGFKRCFVVLHTAHITLNLNWFALTAYGMAHTQPKPNRSMHGHECPARPHITADDGYAEMGKTKHNLFILWLPGACSSNRRRHVLSNLRLKWTSRERERDDTRRDETRQWIWI